MLNMEPKTFGKRLADVYVLYFETGVCCRYRITGKNRRNGRNPITSTLIALWSRSSPKV